MHICFNINSTGRNERVSLVSLEQTNEVHNISSNKMRAVLIVFVCICAVVTAQFGGLSQLEKSKWPGLKTQLIQSLEQLATEQGHHLELVDFESVEYQVVAGSIYNIKAWFKAPHGGENIKCDVKVLSTLRVEFSDVQIKCTEKSYKVVKAE